MAAPVQTLGKDRTNSGNSTTTTVLTVLGNSTAGHTITVHVSSRASANNCTGITDSKSNTYVRVGSSFVSTNSGEIIDIFVCLSPVALTTSDTITATFAGSGNARAVLAIEWGGSFTVPATPVNTGDVSSVTTSPPSVQVTPDNASAIVVGTIAVFSSSVAPTVASPFTLWDTQANTSGSTQEVSVSYRQETTTSADGPAWTTPSQKSASFTFTLDPASGTAWFGDASQTATGTLTAAATASMHASSTLAATGTLTATAARATSVDASLSGSVSATATAGVFKTVTASQAATVTQSASATITHNADAAIVATVTATAKFLTVVSTTPPETALSLASSALAAQALELAWGATVRHGLDVLDDTDNPTGETLPFVEGSVTWSYRPPDPLDGQQNAVTAVRRQASMTLDGDIGQVNLLARRFRLWTEFLLSDGHWARWHLGVFMTAGPKVDDDGTMVSRVLDLADKSYLWSQTQLTDPLHLDDTQTAIPWVTGDLGTRFGETKFAISGDATATVGGNGLTFDTGTDLLTVYSTVLASVGLDALTTNEEGIASSQPLSTLAGRGISAVYGAGARKIVPAGSTQPLVPSVPNVIRFVSRQGPASGGSEGNGIYTVTNQSTGPGSVDARGYSVQMTVQVDAVDQTTLEAVGDANKQRYFAGGGLTFSGSIGLNPTLGDQSVIGISLPRLGLSDPSQAWTVTSWSYPLKAVTDSSAVLMPITAEARVP